MKKIIALFVLCQLILSIINAQIPSTFFENKDAFKSFSYLKKESKTMPAKKMQPVDAARLRAEDDRPRSGDVPFRFGEAFDVNYTLKDGAWEKADTAMVWSLKISSPGAYSLNFIFDRLTLSEGAQLYIFSLDGTMVYGPVTSKQNLPEDGTFLTDLVAGDEAVIQLFEPYHAKVRSTLSISRVVHAYVNLFPSFAKAGVGSSGSCNKDIVCFSEWYNESEAVALVLLANGTEHCSGSLLNNTVQDYRPFFLTAFHCIDSDQNGALSDAEISGSENWAFRFRFKKTTCNGNYVTSYITYNRADFRAAWNGTDFALMELRSFIRENNRHTFLGWDRSGATPTSGVGIHHPSGDVMRISFDNEQLNEASYRSVTGQGHWLVDWNIGVTENGSSGSPLLNQNKHVIGQLHGGFSSCTSPDLRDWYGCFHRSWAGNGTATTRLSNWLDPGSTGATTTNSVRVPAISVPDFVCNGGTDFTVSNAPPGFNWIHSNNLVLQSTSGNQAIFEPQYPETEDFGWIGIAINGTTVAKKDVWVGPPYIVTVTGNDVTSAENTERYEVILSDDYFLNQTFISWMVYPEDGYIVFSDYRYIDVTFYDPGPFWIEFTVSNYCGINNYPYRKDIYVYNSYYYSAYPNPASSILNIDLDHTAIFQAKASVQTTTDGKQLKREKTYDIRLYDNQGNMLRQRKAKGGKVEFNVASLPNGIYYLHIYDGVNEKPEMRQIVVQH